MKTLVLAALCALLALPASAASKKKTPKPEPRTLKELVDIAMKDGTDHFIVPLMVQELQIPESELSEGRLPVRMFAYRQVVCPDDQKHVFNVAYRPGKEQKPLFLVFSAYKAWHDGEKVMADGYTMRASLDGKLEKIVSIKGVVQHGKHTVLDPGSDEAKNAFRHELAFYSHDSVNLERSPR